MKRRRTKTSTSTSTTPSPSATATSQDQKEEPLHTTHNTAQHRTNMDGYSSDEMASWVSRFCAMFGRDYFVEVGQEFIEDDFNLTGLSSIVPCYKQALDTILDLQPETAVDAADVALIEHAADLLYGLIHARYILTKAGLHAMAEKYEENCFGVCPRYYCNNMHLIPIGRYDSPGIETVRLYCPNCNDIYLPSSSRYLNIDGAFFGTSFAGLFMKMFPEIGRQTQSRTKEQFTLKLFGFKVSSLAPSGPRMKWLRAHPLTEDDKKELHMCEFETPKPEECQTEKNEENDENKDDKEMDVDAEADADVGGVAMTNSAGESMMSIV